MIGYSCNLWHLAMCLPVYSNKTSQLFYNKKPFTEKRNNSTRAPGTNQRVEVSWDPTQIGKKYAGKADTDSYQAMSPSHLHIANHQCHITSYYKIRQASLWPVNGIGWLSKTAKKKAKQKQPKKHQKPK